MSDWFAPAYFGFVLGALAVFIGQAWYSHRKERRAEIIDRLDSIERKLKGKKP